MLGRGSDGLHQLGFVTKTPAAPSAETKLDAVQKRAATRRARHTMGKKQRQAIKGEPIPAVSTTAVGGPIPVARGRDGQP